MGYIVGPTLGALLFQVSSDGIHSVRKITLILHISTDRVLVKTQYLKVLFLNTKHLNFLKDFYKKKKIINE